MVEHINIASLELQQETLDIQVAGRVSIVFVQIKVVTPTTDITAQNIRVRLVHPTLILVLQVMLVQIILTR